jgi:hypothetical protein
MSAQGSVEAGAATAGAPGGVARGGGEAGSSADAVVVAADASPAEARARNARRTFLHG